MSQFAAVTWKAKPGFDEEPARLFENYPRPDSFVVADSSPTAFGDFFIAHSMRCLAARRHDQPAAVVSETREDQ